MSNKRRSITKNAIKKHWSDWLVKVDKIDCSTELENADICFACGMERKTQKAHIKPLSKNGIDDKSNIHLLCESCHKASENLWGEKYYHWFFERNMIDTLLQSMVWKGLNLSKYIPR